MCVTWGYPPSTARGSPATAHAMSPQKAPTRARRSPTRRNPPRRAKRQRTEPLPIGQAPLRFDSLSHECVENIFRHMSIKPHFERWKHFLSAESLLSVVQAGGSLASSAREVFTELTAICTHEVQIVHGSSRYSGFQLELVSNPAYDLIPAYGRALRRLHIDVTPDARLVRLVKSHCSGLRALSVIYDGPGCSSLRTLIKNVGGTLHSLEIEVVQLYKADVDALSKYCTQLRHFKFSAERLKVSFAPLWRTVADNLRVLEITLPNNCDAIALDVVAQHCPNITSLTFDNFLDEKGDEIVELCKHYGPQLELIRLLATKLDEDDLRQICAACTNVTVDMRDIFSIGLFTVDCMLALGPAANTVSICEAEEGEDSILDNLERIGRACTNLRRVETNISNIPVEALRNLFVTPKPKLVKFIGKVRGRGSTPDSILRVLTENSSTLEHFKYDGPVPTLELIAPFAAASTRLQKVKLTLCFPERCPCQAQQTEENVNLFEWCPIVKPFLQSKSIKELDFECRIRPSQGFPRPQVMKCSKVATACVPLRASDKSVYICGNRYI